MAEQEKVHRAVLTEDNRLAAYRALQDRILNGEGWVSPEQRARAFSNGGLSAPLDGLLGKVATRRRAGDGRGFRGSTGRGLW